MVSTVRGLPDDKVASLATDRTQHSGRARAGYADPPAASP
jgi:hypothetical protein